MEKEIQEIQSCWKQVIQKGAFVFDLDETLIAPDDSLSHNPEIGNSLLALLKQNLHIAFISGSPGSVVWNRVLIWLKENLGENQSLLEQITFYVNGGSSKYQMKSGEFKEDAAFSKKNQLPADLVLRIRTLMNGYIQRKWDLKQQDYETLLKAWHKKRQEQWGHLDLQFDDAWIQGKPWEIQFWEDEAMALIKSGQGKGKMTYPFINVRRVHRNEAGEMEGLAGFSISGFYELHESRGDALNWDLRDWILEQLKKDLGPSADLVVLRKAGRSSIDGTKKGTDKAAALKNFIQETKRTPGFVSYFGDEFFTGGNDQPVADDPEITESGVRIFALNLRQPPPSKHVHWLGKGKEVTREFLGKIAQF